MAQIERFLLVPGDSSSPLAKAKEAHEDFMFTYRLNKTDVDQTISRFEYEKLSMSKAERAASQGLSEEQLEARLGIQFPDFIVAMNGLRRAFDKLEGMHLVWNECDLRSVRKHDLAEDNGWIRGNFVGAHPVLSGLHIQLEIASTPEDTKGVFLPFDNMCSIRDADADFFNDL